MAPYQQSFEINVSTQNINVGVIGANRQFSSNQHKTIYDSYNVGVVAQKIKSLKIENASSTYALTNEVKYDINDVEDAY